MGAPEWTFVGWPMSVWAVVVAALGVAASTAVAFAAFRASARANSIAIKARTDAIKDERRHERRQFYEAAISWLESEKTNLVVRGVAYYPHQLVRFAHVIDSDTAPSLATWLWQGARLVAAEEDDMSVRRTEVFNSLADTFADNCALWVRSASSNYRWSPFTVPSGATSS